MKTVLFSKDLKSLLNEFGISSLISDDIDYIDVNDVDTISFTPMDKIARIIESGRDPWKTNRVPMKVGKFFKKSFVIEDSKLENLVNWYKTSYFMSKGEYDKIFKVVDGEDIKHWYNQKNYVQGGGSLNGSCMRGEDAQNRLGLYTENPAVVKLLIMTDGDKLLSRALMWTTDRGIYIDRPYCRYDKDQMLYKKYAEVNGYYNYYARNSTPAGVVLTARVRKNYQTRPYLDSFQFNNKVLTTNA
jgi:hypothetical protein